MLQINKRASLSGHEAPKVVGPLIEALQDAIRILRRQLPIVSVIIVCSLALAILYLVNTPPQFTASGAMVIDTRKVQVLNKESVLGETQIDASTVQTQVEMLKSDNIALAVIRKLHLTDDPEFVPPAEHEIKRPFQLPVSPSARERADQRGARTYRARQFSQRSIDWP